MVQENKTPLIIFLGLLSAMGALSIDLYLAGLPRMEAELGASSGQAQLTLGIFLVGFGIGQLIYGPLSDRFGRKPLLIAGITLYTATSILCAVAGGIHIFILSRFLQAIGASTGQVLSRAIVRDHFDGSEVARIFSFISMITLTAPLIAPVIGGYIVVWSGWRTVFYVLAAFGGLCLLATVLWFDESHSHEQRSESGRVKTLQAYLMVFSNKKAALYILCGAVNVGVMFAYLTGAPYLYIQIFGVEPQNFGYFISINGLALITGAYANSRLVRQINMYRLVRWGIGMRLTATAVLLLVVTFKVGGLPAVVVLLFLTTFPANIIASNCYASALHFFPRISGTASAVIGAFSFLVGSLAGLQVSMLDDGTPIPMMLTMFLFSLLGAMIFLVFIKNE